MSLTDRIREALGARILGWHEHSPRRIYVTVRPEDLKECARIFFKDLGLRFSTATGIDAPGNIELTYHFSSDSTGRFISLRVHLEDRETPRVDSISGIMKGAEWIERELWELLGVDFKGHPDLKRLLLSEDWPEGKYPLRNEENAEKTGNPDA